MNLGLSLFCTREVENFQRLLWLKKWSWSWTVDFTSNFLIDVFGQLLGRAQLKSVPTAHQKPHTSKAIFSNLVIYFSISSWRDWRLVKLNGELPECSKSVIEMVKAKNLDSLRSNSILCNAKNMKKICHYATVQINETLPLGHYD